MKAFKTFVHFDDCDPAGILFFGNYYKLAHRALEEFFQASPLGWEGWFRHATCAFPLKHSEADYSAPIRSGSTIWIHVNLDKIGDSSATFQFQFRKDQDSASDLLAEVRTVHVCVNFKEKKKVSIPEDLRKHLEKLKSTLPS